MSSSQVPSAWNLQLLEQEILLTKISRISTLSINMKWLQKEIYMTSNKSSFIFYTLKCLIHEPPSPEQGNEFLHKVLPNKRCQLTSSPGTLLWHGCLTQSLRITEHLSSYMFPNFTGWASCSVELHDINDKNNKISTHRLLVARGYYWHYSVVSAPFHFQGGTAKNLLFHV